MKYIVTVKTEILQNRSGFVESKNRLLQIANENGTFDIEKDQTKEAEAVVKHILLFDTLISTPSLVIRNIKDRKEELYLGSKQKELTFFFYDVSTTTLGMLRWMFNGAINVTDMDVIEPNNIEKELLDLLHSESAHTEDGCVAVKTSGNNKRVKETLDLIDSFTIFSDKLLSQQYIRENAERDVRAWYYELKTKGKSAIEDPKWDNFMNNTSTEKIMYRVINFINQYKKLPMHDSYISAIEFDPIIRDIKDDGIYSMFVAYACYMTKHQIRNKGLLSEDNISKLCDMAGSFLTEDIFYRFISRLDQAIAENPNEITVLFKSALSGITKENIMRLMMSAKDPGRPMNVQHTLQMYGEMEKAQITLLTWYFTYTYDEFGPIYGMIITDIYENYYQLIMDKFDRVSKDILDSVPPII